MSNEQQTVETNKEINEDQDEVDSMSVLSDHDPNMS